MRPGSGAPGRSRVRTSCSSPPSRTSTGLGRPLNTSSVTLSAMSSTSAAASALNSSGEASQLETLEVEQVPLETGARLRVRRRNQGDPELVAVEAAAQRVGDLNPLERSGQRGCGTIVETANLQMLDAVSLIPNARRMAEHAEAAGIGGPLRGIGLLINVRIIEVHVDDK